MKLGNRILISLVLPLSLAVAGGASAGKPAHGMTDPAQRIARLSDRLGLDQGQQTQLAAIMEAHAPEMKALRARLHEQRKVLHGHTRDYDEASVRAEAQALGEITAELAVVSARARAQFYQLLTAEQQAKLEHRRRHRPRPGAHR